MDLRQKLRQNYPYELNSDAEQGFADAVHNNQINLAMYYMIELFSDLQESVKKLEKTVAKKRTVTKKATATKEARTEE